MEDLRERWIQIHKDYLPSLAKARDPSQKHWPVHLDHCFARIILDNAIGIEIPWTEVLKLPAVRNMDKNQLESVIELAERIATGEADLNALNERSLQIRNKKRKIAGESHTQHHPKRQRHERSTISSYFLHSPSPPRTKAVFTTAKTDLPNMSESEDADDSEEERMKVQLRRIANSDLTDFRKQALSLLCQVPRGRYSTYQAMSDYITTTSHKTCARAVGNAMRNNPFAPEVPCHRILAADGSLGGFCGHWGENGKFANRKHDLLYREGVRFASNGKVKGPPFREFKQVEVKEL